MPESLTVFPPNVDQEMNNASRKAPAVFRRAAILGSGVMGRAIAAHLANAGLDVVLLDMPPKDAPADDAAARNALSIAALKALPREKPAPLFHKDLARRITVGNFEDDLAKLSQVDWVIEAVVERLDIKQSLLSKVAQHLAPHAILSTNTSGIPVDSIAEALPADVQSRFLGTHFFNPPRYMHLLEVIPGANTDPSVVSTMANFGERALGKGVVHAKDRPNFIANRIGVYGMMRSFQLMIDHGLSVEEVDALTGPLVGRAKSATFRTSDLVGLDVLLHVAHNVREGAPNDPEIAAFTPHEKMSAMLDKGLLGQKSGGGFYKKVKGDKGTEILTLDLETLEYRAKAKPRLPEVDAIRQAGGLPKRLIALAKTKKGKGAAYAWELLRDTLRYAALVAPDVTGDVASVDRAMRWGFGWKLGPFEIWDILGLETVAKRMEAEGSPAPQWVLDHIAAGATSFYQEGSTLALTGEGNVAVPVRPDILDLRETPDGPRVVEKNSSASLWDLGDGILGLEYHSKMNSIGGDTIAMTSKAVELAEREFEGMVVGNQGSHFSAGANLAMLLLGAIEGEWEDIDLMVRQFQNMTMGLRRCARPVVVAPFGMALGGGAEVTLHGDAVCASAELYMGLVEAGVGLIPAGAGTKDMYLRMLDSLGPDADPRNAARRAFEVIGLAKISTSAAEARDLGFLRKGDSIVMNADGLIAAAKAKAMAMANTGYTAPPDRSEIPVGGKDTYALLEVGLFNYLEAKQISEHDHLIGMKLAAILSGGAHREGHNPAFVSEQDMLDLEREAFLSLCGQRKSLERIQHMLKTGKPLRN